MTTAVPTGHEPTIGERVAYTREHLSEDQRDPYEEALREATEGALGSGQKRLIEAGRWDELFPGPGRDVDEVIEELLR